MTGPELLFGKNLTVRQILTRRLLPGFAGLALLGVATAVGVSSAEDPRSPEPTRPVKVVSPQPVDGYAATREFTGRIEARRTADLAHRLQHLLFGHAQKLVLGQYQQQLFGTDKLVL